MEGLCNRMRVIASGVFIARRLGAAPVVYWNKTPNCSCDFSDLFALPAAGLYEVRAGGGMHSIASKYNLWWPLLLRRLRYGQVIRCFDVNSMGDIFPRIKDVDSLVLESHSPMAENYPINRLFSPREDILGAIDEAVNDFDDNVIGVHVRRTDNILSRSRSPLTSFIDIMDADIRNNPKARFFLATDDVETRRALVGRYGRRILYHDNILSRDSVAGMRDALIDLYCLSRTRKIVGSYWSSFSGMAAEIGGIELVIA